MQKPGLVVRPILQMRKLRLSAKLNGWSQVSELVVTELAFGFKSSWTQSGLLATGLQLFELNTPILRLKSYQRMYWRVRKDKS